MNERRIHFVSLGCPKNRVDSEVMLGVAENEGYRHTRDAEEADVIVVNTCGFIEAAKEESIETILELGQLKDTGRCKKLVVAGCLSQRYGADLAEGMPEVDHFLGSSDMLRLGEVLRDQAPRLYVGNPADWVMRASDPRRLSTRGASAYVKIAEGCNRSCSFCVIPSLRGKQRSRSPEDVVHEVEQLAQAGVLEVNLVSQDTVAYGRDRKDTNLTELLRRLAGVEGLRWLRVFYLYPETLSDELIELFAEPARTGQAQILPYIDMPLQHAADSMLRRMRRGHGGQRLVDLVERLRGALPEMVFRTAFIVGHPGETQSDFNALKDFVRWARFDRVGVFCYSDEDTALSATLADKVPPELARERAQELMELQRDISRERNRALIGRDVDVLVEGVSDESDLVMQGRYWGQAPDIDGSVYISGGPVRPGRIVRGRVEDASDYDLNVDVGELDDQPIPAERPGASLPILQRHSDGRVVLRTV